MSCRTENTICNFMLYHNIKSSDENRKIQKMIVEEQNKNYSNTFYQKVQQIAEKLEIKTDKLTDKKKSTWKKEVEEKVRKSKKRMIEEIARRTRCKAQENDKWGRKEYIKESNSGTIKDVIKIRLYMSELKANYGRKVLDDKGQM